MTVWRLVANWVLPPPLILFALLSLPLPRNVKQGMVLFVQKVFDLPIVGRFKLLHIMLWLTAVAFLGTARQLQLLHAQQTEQVWATPNMEIHFLSKRWRAERNLWMGAFAFSAWVFLAAFYREAVRRMALEARLSEMERSDFTATETREREPSISREVTSKAGRTPLGGSPAKPAAGGANITGGAGAATQAAAGPEKRVGQVKDASAGAAGVEMAELKKEL